MAIEMPALIVVTGTVPA